MNHKPPLSVALVYPPFGPAGVPSLGLALLSASLKRLGFDCHTYYWNLDFASRLPGRSPADRLRSYWWLTGRAWYPFSEWAFSRLVHDDRLDAQHSATLQALQDRDGLFPGGALTPHDILALRDRAAEEVDLAAERLSRFSVIGIATTFFQNLPALALARRLKRLWPDKTVVLGGANCDGEMGPALFNRFDFLDYAAVGEADDSFPALVHRLAAGGDVRSVPGLLGRDRHAKAWQAPPSLPIHDLDALPFPDFDDFMGQREQWGLASVQKTTLALESSRGCWWGQHQHCTFCGLNANGMAYRRKTPERFQDEVQHVARRYSAQYLFMTDNILPVEYHQRFLDWARTSGLGLKLFYEIKSNAKPSQVAQMAQAGITAVQPGIESFSSALLKQMRKGVTGAQNVAFLRAAREFGVRASYNLLVGFPGADPAHYDQMAEQLPRLFHLRPPSAVVPIEFHRFSPYHQNPQTYQLHLRPSEWYFHLYPFPEDEISRLAYVFRADDEFQELPGLSRLAEQVARWRSLYTEDDCQLTWWKQGAGVAIEDRRPGFPLARYLLHGYAAELFQQLDQPRSLQGLTRQARLAPPDNDSDRLLRWIFAPQDPGVAVISFDADDFLANPAACLHEFASRGLIFEDTVPSQSPPGLPVVTGEAQPDHWYVALPVPASWRRADETWEALGV